MTKNRVVCRCLLGASLGIAIGYVVTLAVSWVWGGDTYLPCTPALTRQLGSEVSAVILQAALCALLGAVLGASSLIWSVMRWSILKRTVIYFLVLSVTLLPIAYINHWMEHTAFGIIYWGIGLEFCALLWTVQYSVWRYRSGKQ